MEPNSMNKAKKDQDLLRYLTGQAPAPNVQTVNNDDPVASTSVTAGLVEAVTEITLDDVEVTGVHPHSGVEILEIKQEPDDPDSAGQVIGGQVAMDTGDLSDDDVIFVDRETTLKYLTGEISFEEYSAHLEVKDDPDVIEEPELVVTATEVAQPSTSEARGKGTEADGSPRIKKAKIRKSRLPRDLMGLMGEANMRYARGNTEEAVKMCMEIIRLAPAAPEPFQTLSMIYEEQGDTTKGLQYALIAAHLKSDLEEWLRVAEMCLEQEQYTQAIRCYSKAIAIQPKDIDLWWKRCELCERVGDKRLALQGYQVIMKLLPEDSGEKYLQIARDLTKNFHAGGDADKAVEVMSRAFEVHPKFVTAEDVNLLSELYLHQKQYSCCVAILIQHCGVCLTYKSGTVLTMGAEGQVPVLTEDDGPPVRCEAPEEIPVDLRAKLTMCLIHLGYQKCVSAVADPILKLSSDEVGDLHLDIAEAFMDKGVYKKARTVLASLVWSENYNLAAVWLRYGDCLRTLGDLPTAVTAYKNVVDLAPTHLGARVSLASIQQQLGLHEEALAALDTTPRQDSGQASGQDTENQPKVDARLLLHKCSLLFSQKKIPEFIDCAQELLFSHVKAAYNKEIFRAIISSRSSKNRINNLKFMLGAQFETQLQSVRDLINEGGIKLEDLWELFVKLCNVLVDQQMYQKFEDITILGQILPPFYSDATIHREVEFLCLTACLMNQNGYFGYCFVRDLCLENLENNSVWNLFCQIVTVAKDLRHNRFCLRLMMKHPEHHALGILNGHNAMIAGSYKHALGEYVSALKQQPQDPLLSLCVGIAFMHLASQKYAARRNTLIVQGCSFLNQYLELRGECQESNYNLGRAMHQMGLLHAAVHYYNKALALPPAVQDTPEHKEIFDLSREAAFNLSLIYQSSGSHDLACHVINEHFVI